MQNILSNWPLIKAVLIVFVGFNVFVGVIKKALDSIQDSYAAAKKADAVVSKLSALLAKIADWISGNLPHE